MNDYVLWFNEIDKPEIVGGKNASLARMTRLGLPVPDGFAVTSDAYDSFVLANNLSEFIEAQISGGDTEDIRRLDGISKSIHERFMTAEFPADLKDTILSNYEKLRSISQSGCAVRSSATAEDLPTASFAGQQETFLNVRDAEELLRRIKECFSSAYTSRAIVYRKEKGFSDVKMSVGVQKLVNSMKSGVMFTVEPNSGNDNILIIDSSYGLGELVVSGKVVPDQYTVFKPTAEMIKQRVAEKNIMLVPVDTGLQVMEVSTDRKSKPSLSNGEIKKLAELASMIQKHYGRQMDIEWAIEDDDIYILQARPETVHSAASVDETYKLEEDGKELLRGIAIGNKISVGAVQVLENSEEMDKFVQGSALVTKMTSPHWVPILNKASAVVTEEGGTTSHAAIVSRELGIPCIVGARDAMKILAPYENNDITIDCSEGVGKVYEGKLVFTIDTVDTRNLPKTKTQIMVNISRPEVALQHARKCDGVGLLRLEFVYAHDIGIHPLALVNFNQLKLREADGPLKKTLSEIEEQTRGFENKEQFFIEKLAEGIGLIAAAMHPNDVIVRFSDFKTNEYRGLIGGYLYETEENNPMLGWRGASRYVHPSFEPAFRLECRAIKLLRDKGLVNIIPMIPFCRTTTELAKIVKIMEQEGLKRSEGMRLYLMAEVPSNILNADEFCQYIDGFSIGSNDLTQLMLGVDRDSSSLARDTFNENDSAVKKAISYLLKVARIHGKKVGICGQAPSDYPDFVEFLVREGIDSISLNPDVVAKTRKLVAEIEGRY